MARYLVTGCAGFIGSSLTDRLLADGNEVIGVDCFTDYYARTLKEANIAPARDHENFALHELDLAHDVLPASFAEVDGVFHQAAQAGVRASWGDEFSLYCDCNLLATQRILEHLVTHRPDAPPRIVYASSSSIYGDALTRPTSETALPQPVSPYGVTKLAAEHLCATYHRNHGVPAAALRYFTVFGPRQRPDMAFHRFCRWALAGEEIAVYGDGEQSRDFTYIDDIVTGNVQAMADDTPWLVCNLGGGSTITVRQTLEIIEQLAGTPLNVCYGPVQLGDVRHTSADTSIAQAKLGFAPQTPVRLGLEREFAWIYETFFQ